MLDKLKKNKELLICGSFVFAFILLYHSLYFNSVYPVSEGWGVYYAELVKRGAVPYRDFYYYLMPLSLGLDYIFWNLSFGSLLMFRAWYFIQRIAMILVLYKLLCKFVKPRFACVGCVAGTALGAGTQYDLVGDYNQTEVFLVIILMYLLVKFLENAKAEKLRQSLVYIFFSGVTLGLIILLKQSTAVAASIVCLVFFVAYCITYKNTNWLRYSISVVIGVLLPIAICFAYLAINGAFGDFISQILGSGSSKGSLSDILLSFSSKLFDEKKIVLCSLVVVIFILSVAYAAKSKNKFTVAISVLLGIASTYSIGYMYDGDLEITINLLKSAPYLYLVIPVLLSVFVPIFIKSKSRVLSVVKSYNSLIIFGTIVLVLFFIALINPADVLHDLNNQVVSGRRNATFIITGYLCGAASLMGFVSAFVYRAVKKADLFDIKLLPLFVGSFILYYSCAMATISSSTVTSRYMFVAASVFISLFLSYAKLPKKLFEVKNAATLLLCCCICFICLNQKITGPYSWWGTAPAPIEERTESIEGIPALRGIKVTKKEKDMYEKIVAAIEENTEEGDTVWGFPHVKIFNILTDNYDLSDPVPVIFYDVCPADKAAEELSWLQENPPDIILRCEIPNCIETHDRAGLDMSSHYDIFKYLNPTLRDRYELVEFQNDVCVYKLIK